MSIYKKPQSEQESHRLHHKESNFYWNLIIMYKGLNALTEYLKASEVHMIVREIGTEEEYNSLIIHYADPEKESKEYPFFWARTPFIFSKFIDEKLQKMTWK